jgi:hypothetical protein
MLERWDQRPREEAYLFNPAFCGVLACEFVKAFAGKEKSGAPLTLVLLALTISLHCSSRERLPKTTTASLYQWVQSQEEILIGFARRAVVLRPYVLEGVRFTVGTKALSFADGQVLALGEKPATYTAGRLQNETSETKRIVEQTRMLGRWFSRSGEESFILSAFGVRP